MHAFSRRPTVLGSALVAFVLIALVAGGWASTSGLLAGRTGVSGGPSIDDAAALVSPSFTPSPSPPGARPSPTSSGATAMPSGASPSPAGASPSPAGATASPAGATASPAPGTFDLGPIVPVVDFRSAETSVTAADVGATLEGASRRYSALELVAADASGILAALGQSVASDSDRLVRVADGARLSRDLATHRDRLGFLRAAEVTPAVRALEWEGRGLFGVDRAKRLTDWPLRADLPRNGEAEFEPQGLWTMLAGGDILLDRGVARQVTLLHKGVDFPFDGGTARIASRYCCSPFGWRLPRGVRTGDVGAVRHLLRAADLAVANFENPAPVRFAYHTHGTIFSANPALIAGLEHAGIDWVSTANNHIGDAGRKGVTETIANLAHDGIATSGSGADLAAAHKAAMLGAGGVKVAFLGYDTIAKYYAASASTAGSAQMTPEALRADVKAARTAGAQVVVVYPHWGIEYTTGPTALQRSLAHAAIDAGADLVIGNHPHWVEAMEVYKGHAIWYGLGNFVFDQTWSEPTEEGLLLELTFRDTELVQARLRPTLILDGAQPNLLDPAGDGAKVLGQLFTASKRLLPW